MQPLGVGGAVVVVSTAADVAALNVVETTGDDDMMTEEDRDCHQYDESALLDIPVHLDKTDFRPTWYHDTSHIPKESHNVYFKKKKKKNDYNHSKKRNRR